MPIRDSLHLNVGDELSLKNCSITGVSTVESYKYFAACQDIKVLAKDTTKAISIMPKKVETLIEQNTWQPMSIKREPDKKIKSLNAVYSVWYNSDDIVLGKEDKGIVISKEKLQKWAEVLMNN